VDATRIEATEGDAHAVDAWLAVLDAAVDSPESPWALPAEAAALDALAERVIPALDDASGDTALAHRTREAGRITARVAQAAARGKGPFAPSLAARALTSLAADRGDAGEAAKQRAAIGCASAATVVGPLAWTSVSGVHEPDPLQAFDAALMPTYEMPGTFARLARAYVVGHRGCVVDPGAVTVTGGTRDVVVDVRVDRAQTIGVVLRAHSAATLRAGGRVVAERAYDLGGDEVARLARVVVPRAGTLRLVARVGTEDDDEGVEIDALDDHGRALPTHAPRAGDAADVRVDASSEVAWPEAKSDVERAALAFAALAMGDRVTAERVTWPAISRDDAPPAVLLAYARAVEDAGDLDAVHRSERARGAYERVLEAWPGAWEAIAAHAHLAGVRRGQTEQRIWTLRDLDERRAKAGDALANRAVLDALDAAIAGHDRLLDRAKSALDRATRDLGGAPFVRDASRSVIDHAGTDRVAFECAETADALRGRLDCYDALRATGDRARAAAELDRVRALYGAPLAYLALSMREALAAGDLKAAARAYDAMMPGERSLAMAYAARQGDDARATLAALAPFVRDAPSSLPALFRDSGDDPTAPFAGVAERVTAEDRAHPILPDAATAVLAHAERYDVAPNGLVRFVLFDVRRVTTTTDVDENAQADPPQLGGRVTMRIARRRVFKKDGRVVEPDRAPGAEQSHAELSQLEQGDAVEAIYEGWSLPGDEGQITIDTPDMLPDRTAVHDATIELRVPSSLATSLWSHALLGKPEESKDGDARVLRWSVKDAPVRRIEEGTPRMDRDVAVSLSTSTWSDTARALRETLASLEERDPEVGAWARAAAKGAKGPGQRAVVDAIVAAAGRDVKEANPSLLSDVEVGRPQGAQQTTARSILSTHEGSRTWLVVRALRELGIAADVVVAENEPFSASPDFPPHQGRFIHPLAIAHVKSDEGKTPGGDVWIDADVAGPPLPAGRVSPELRGRSALATDGSIVPVVAQDAEDERDEVDLRLAVDANGDAKGSLMVLLRGRAAQELAEALFRMVGDERQRMLRGVALAWVPFADVDDVVLSSSEESWQVAVRASLAIPGFAQLAGSDPAKPKAWVLPGLEPVHAVYPRPTVATLGASYASQGARKDALAIAHALQYHVHRRVELPGGATVTRAPGVVDVRSPVLTAQRRVAVSPGAIEDDFTLSLATGTVAARDYAGFAADAHAIDDGFLASTRVKP
jgi:hypothetical protein